MTLDQVQGLCAGISKLERRDAQQLVSAVRLAMHGSDDDVDRFMSGHHGQNDDAELDAVLAKYQGGEGG